MRNEAYRQVNIFDNSLSKSAFLDRAFKGRNKTILLNENEKQSYFSRCFDCSIFDKISLEKIQKSILFGDTFKVLKKLPCKFVDLLIVDPPYNLTKNYSENEFSKMSDSEYQEFTEKWVSLVRPTLKDNASLYVCCDWKSSLIIGKVLEKHFFIQNRITWQREKGRGAKANWKNSMEDIWFATVSKTKFTFNIDAVKQRRRVIAPYKVDGKPKDWQETENGNFRDTHPGNFWDDISIPYWSMPENTAHPTQKPEKLIAKIVLASSNKGDFIFDPFLGSGTSVVVAKKLQRNFSGIELEKEYCAISQKRLEKAETDKKIQGFCDGVFWERNTLQEQEKFRKADEIK